MEEWKPIALPSFHLPASHRRQHRQFVIFRQRTLKVPLQGSVDQNGVNALNRKLQSGQGVLNGGVVVKFQTIVLGRELLEHAHQLDLDPHVQVPFPLT